MKPSFDLLQALIEEWLPLDVERDEPSADARQIFLGLLAIAEQLKEARSDRKE